MSAGSRGRAVAFWSTSKGTKLGLRLWLELVPKLEEEEFVGEWEDDGDDLLE